MCVCECVWRGLYTEWCNTVTVVCGIPAYLCMECDPGEKMGVWVCVKIKFRKSNLHLFSRVNWHSLVCCESLRFVRPTHAKRMFCVLCVNITAHSWLHCFLCLLITLDYSQITPHWHCINMEHGYHTCHLTHIQNETSFDLTQKSSWIFLLHHFCTWRD